MPIHLRWIVFRLVDDVYFFPGIGEKELLGARSGFTDDDKGVGLLCVGGLEEGRGCLEQYCQGTEAGDAVMPCRARHRRIVCRE